MGWIGVRASKCGPALGGLGVDAVDRVDAQQAPVLLAVLGARGRAGDAVAGPQPEAADLARADVDVVRAGHEAAPAHEAVAVVDDVEDARAVRGLWGWSPLLPPSISSRSPTLRSSLTDISRRSRTSRSLRSRAASSSASSSCSVTGRRLRGLRAPVRGSAIGHGRWSGPCWHRHGRRPSAGAGVQGVSRRLARDPRGAKASGAVAGDTGRS